MNIQIKCRTGYEIKLDDLCLFPGNLKKHSIMEIERIVESILEDGYLFPITVGQLDNKNYIIDGECTYLALLELCERGYNIPLLPVIYTQVNEDTIKKVILIGTSTNHCVTYSSLINFTKGSQVRNKLKNLSFNEGTLIDFWTVNDLKRIFMKYEQKKPKVVSDVDFRNLLIEGEI